jgi:hypothetical protein
MLRIVLFFFTLGFLFLRLSSNDLLISSPLDCIFERTLPPRRRRGVSVAKRACELRSERVSRSRNNLPKNPMVFNSIQDRAYRAHCRYRSEDSAIAPPDYAYGCADFVLARSAPRGTPTYSFHS